MDSVFEPCHEVGYVFVVYARSRKGLAVVVEEDIVGLRGDAEFVVLEVAPTFAHGGEFLGYAVFFHVHGFRESLLVVNHKHNHHIVALYYSANGGSVEYRSFHLSAVDTGVAGEIDNHRLVVRCGIGHSFVVVVEFLELASVQVEVLCVQRRGECRYCFKRGAPESGYEVDCERERCHSHKEAAYGCVAHLAVVAET